MRRVPIFVLVLAIVFAGAARPTSLAASQATSSPGPVVIEGTIVMAIEDDFQKGRATRRYFLKHSAQLLDLRLTTRQAAGLEPNMTVRIIGQLVGNVLTADPSDESVVVLGTPGARPPAATR